MSRNSARPGPTPLAEIAEALRRADRVLAICHVSPDGDAIGSLLALGWILRGLHAPPSGCGVASLDRVDLAPAPGRAPSVRSLVCADAVPPQFQWLAGASAITPEPPSGPWDIVVALDASDPQRLGKPFRPSEYGPATIINLDHHITNVEFGALNYVDPAAVATSQIVLDLAQALGIDLTPEIARCLLTGIVTDTIGFRTSNVDRRVMAAVTRLMDAGASLSEVIQRSLNYKPLSMLRLWGLALSRLEAQQGVIWAEITQEMRRQAMATEGGDGGLVSQLINAPEAKIAVVFSETPDGQVEIGFRSRTGYTVSEVAFKLGGGGHPQASGCTIPGPLAAARSRVLPMLWAEAAKA